MQNSIHIDPKAFGFLLDAQRKFEEGVQEICFEHFDCSCEIFESRIDMADGDGIVFEAKVEGPEGDTFLIKVYSHDGSGTCEKVPF
jgi:hypothetical protein